MPHSEIRDKLDRFIRRYYANQLLRGALLGASLLLGVFLFLNLSEYYGHFSSPVRAILFWSFWAVLAAVAWKWIFLPLRGLYRLGKIISYEQAAEIIGRHFSHVGDKLINLLQLERMQISHPESALLAAGIAQKTRELKPVPFANAINLSANKKYLRYLALPLLLMGVILVFQSNIITESSGRILHFNTHYAVKAPFSFILQNRGLNAVKGEDISVFIRLEGKSIPEEVYLNYLGQDIKMIAAGDNKFIYTLKNIQKTGPVYFSGGGFTSDEYTVNVVPRPMLTGSSAEIIYPAYTGKYKETVQGATDFSVPEGTEIVWTFDTRDVEWLSLETENHKQKIEKMNDRGRFQLSKKIMSNLRYSIIPVNTHGRNADTLSYLVESVPDQLPVIFTEQKDDTMDIHRFYFIGNASDDYGIRKINFRYHFSESEDAGKVKTGWITIPMNPQMQGNQAEFLYVLDMNALGMSPSDKIEYFFEVWDNDAIHGSKSSKTTLSVLRRKSLDESRKDADKTAETVKNHLKDAFKDAKEMQEKSRQMQDQLNRQRNSSWESRSRIEDLLKNQEDMLDKIEQIGQEHDKLKQEKEEFQKNDAFKERQNQMDELFKQMEDPEIKKLMDEIKKLLEKQASKDQLNEKLNELERKNRDWSRDLEKLMEQYKQLQMEQKLTDNIDRLEKLSEEQKKLAEETQNSDKKSSENLRQKQEDLNRKFDDIQKEIKEAEQMNQELKQPMNLNLGEAERKEARSQMGEADKELSNGKNNKASEKQDDAAEKMKEAAQKMKKSLEDEKEKRLAEDYQKIRELLENLVDASFEQEDVFTELKTLKEYNPKFVELNRRQMKVKEECAMIEDSLRLLAMRQPMISTFITREISRMNTNMDYALENLKKRAPAEAAVREQYVMTGLNNVAVMLMESLDQMQEQLAQQKKKQGDGSCNNPGGKGQGKGKAQDGNKLSEGQKQLGQSLQELQGKAQQQRNAQNGEGAGKEGKRQLNEEYAKAALMQEALRRKLQEMRRELEKEGPEGKAASRELQKTEQMMEQQERDLVNKKITPEMIKRQKEIETRMLEHEKAERKQHQDEERQSQNPGNYIPEIPPALKEYIKEKSRERELLRKSPPELTPYYRDKSREYLRSVK